MSLITIDRSLFASDVDSSHNADGSDAVDSSSRSSQSEDFLMCKATAVGLNVRSRRRSSYIKPNDDIQDHLKKILSILRFGDYLQLVVRLQSDVPRPHHHRYCCIISTTGKQGTEESTVLGVDLTDRRATIGLVLPIWQDMSVNLFGDGGFELITKDTEKQFKPVSVQALWAAFQAVNRACQVARTNDYFSRGLTHDWVSYYHNLPASDTYQIQEWLKTDDIDGFNRYSQPSPLSENATGEEKERHRMESLIRVKLQEIMYSVDLEEVTVLQLRKRLEDDLGQQLRDYRHFIEEEVLTIYGRMDEASEIFDHLLLGTTFNASNRGELERRSVTHILNVTREVDNFFPGDKFEYKNIRVFDDEQSSLLPYFEDTHRFINEAKAQGTCCLVHCRMGISRSATAVIAYAMKEQNWDLDTALTYVKGRRPCVQPNAGFMRELRTYQGILEASSNRHKPIFRKEANLLVQRQPVVPVTPPAPPSKAVDFATEEPSPEVSGSPGSQTASSDVLSDLCRTVTPVPDPVVSDLAKHAPDVPGVDLEAELFAFKPSTNTSIDVLLLGPEPQGESCGLERPTSSMEKRTSNKPLRSDAPIIVWDLEAGVQPRHTQSDRTTLLARNSHCLRQWHPDLVENIGFVDTTEFLLSHVQPDPCNEISDLCYGDVQFLLPPKSEDLVDTGDWPVVTCREASTLTTEELSDPDLSERFCVVHSMNPHNALLLATINKPALLYTGIHEQQIVTDSFEESHSNAIDTRPGLALNSNLPYVLRMAPRLTDITPVRADFSITPESVESPVVTSTSVTPSLVRLVPSDRRRTLPGIIRSTTSFPFRSTELRSSFPPSFSRKHGPRIMVPSDMDVNTPVGFSAAIPISHSSAIGCTESALDQSLPVVSNLSATPNAATNASFSRSMCLPSRSYILNSVNRTQSTRTPVTQRLRPDDSWIVPLGATNVSSEDVDSTEQGNPSALRLRPVSSICLSSFETNAASAGSGTDNVVSNGNGNGNVCSFSSLKCLSVVSGNTSAPTSQTSALSLSPVNQSRKILQFSTSSRVAPVSIEPIHLSRLGTANRETQVKQSTHRSFVTDSSQSGNTIPAAPSSCANTFSSVVNNNDQSSSSRDYSETSPYPASFRPVRRIVNWPPKSADPVATKS
ncbi:SSH2 [Fasciola gigantica]|uniref:protein-serine/threonine phosphatase n=1 Tax=Fasciola gigantica TaxID=46835 RepID=A0A504YZK6_FASGI|nr:SSH2 [Fasciola gigantica]